MPCNVTFVLEGTVGRTLRQQQQPWRLFHGVGSSSRRALMLLWFSEGSTATTVSTRHNNNARLRYRSTTTAATTAAYWRINSSTTATTAATSAWMYHPSTASAVVLGRNLLGQDASARYRRRSRIVSSPDSCDHRRMWSSLIQNNDTVPPVFNASTKHSFSHKLPQQLPTSVRYVGADVARIGAEELVADNDDTATANTVHRHPSSHNKNDKTTKRRKYFWTYDQLVSRTRRLLDYCLQEDDVSTDGTDNNKEVGTAVMAGGRKPVAGGKIPPYSPHISLRQLNRRGRPLATEFFHILEAWMEQSLFATNSTHAIAAARQARRLLEAMVPMYDDINNADNPLNSTDRRSTSRKKSLEWMAHFLTSGHYDVVLQAYVVSGAGATAANEAEMYILRPMIQRCRDHVRYHRFHYKRRPPPPEPTTKTFNIVLNGWAKSGGAVVGGRRQDDTADRATQLLQLMEEWNLECLVSKYYTGCWPNERSLVSLIEAWMYSHPQEAPERALALLQEVMFVVGDPIMETKQKAAILDGNATVAHSNRSRGFVGDSNDNNSTHKYRNVKLDVAVFNAVIYAWVRSGRGRSAAVQAEDILQMLTQWSQIVNISTSSTTTTANIAPNTRTYSMVIMAWAVCEAHEQRGDAAQRGEKILRKMVQLYRAGSDNIKPNAILFTTCIAAWSRAAPSCLDAPDRAMELWQLLFELYAETGQTDPDLAPTAEIGNAVLSAWARCTHRIDAIQRAMDTLETMKQANLVDLISYNTVLDAMSKRGHGKEAVELLEWLETASHPSGSTVPRPNQVSYNSVLASLSRSNTNRDACAEEAERILRVMEKPNAGQFGSDRKPDHMSYTSVINAWSRSDSPQKAERAMALVQDMIRQYEAGNTNMKPDVVVYTILIKACAHIHGAPEDKQKALLMALSAMTTLEQSSDFGPPNDVAYATLLIAIVRLSNTVQQREAYLETVFRNCADRGCVSRHVVEIMNRGGSRRLFRRVTNRTNRLHPSWSCNVAAKDRPT